MIELLKISLKNVNSYIKISIITVIKKNTIDLVKPLEMNFILKSISSVCRFAILCINTDIEYFVYVKVNLNEKLYYIKIWG